jgi:hypothetical protein
MWVLNLVIYIRVEEPGRVFENGMLRKKVGPKRDKATGQWRRLRNEKFHDMYSSASIVWAIKSKRMRWPGFVTDIGERRGTCSVLVGEL